MSDLKACPFCGASNVGFDVCHTEGSHWVECAECHAMSTPNYSPESAARDWNNRPYENKLKAEAFKAGVECYEYIQKHGVPVEDAFDQWLEHANKLEKGE